MRQKGKEGSTKNLGKYAEYFTAFVTLQHFKNFLRLMHFQQFLGVFRHLYSHYRCGYLLTYFG